MKIKFKKLAEESKLPSYNHATDSGIDFFSYEGGEILPGKTEMISTKIAWEPTDEEQFYNFRFKTLLKIEGRSSLGKKGIDVLGGIIDQDYRGEIKVLLHNSSDETFRYSKWDKIAQGIIYSIPKVEIIEVNFLSDTERGEKGFGSSGK